MIGARLPLNAFAIPFGLAGLGVAWLTAADADHAPAWVGSALLATSAVGWLLMIMLYLAAYLSRRRRLATDLTDPVRGPFASLALIIPMLLAADGLAPYQPDAARVLVDVFLVLTVLFGGWITGQWIYRPIAVDQLHPGYFLPTVAGGLVASIAASVVGQPGLARVMLGLGLVCWVVLGSLILGRLILRPPLPPPLTPTMAIEVAPAALAALALWQFDRPEVDALVALTSGYGLLMVIAQVRLLAAYRRLRFELSFWSFTFPWAAVATVSLHWLDAGRPVGHQVYAYLLLAAVTVLVAVIAVRTALAGLRGSLLPPA